jgi:hypothetical protein
MSNPSGPDQGNEPAVDSADDSADERSREETTTDDDASASEESSAPEETQTSDSEPATEAAPVVTDEAPAVEEHPTEVMAVESTGTADTDPPQEAKPAERRFTAPSGFDSSTQKMETPPEPATEVLSVSDAPGSAAAAAATTGPIPASGKPAAPQVIPARGDAPKPPGKRRSWGWVVALILVIAALVAVAILGTVLLTRSSGPKESQEDMVRSTIQNFDVAVQNGDLATLRSITCGATRDSYVNYDDRAWADTHARVAAAKQYPVVASIDQVVVNGDHAEANVTTFMAYAPQTRSTRSFDLQFRDDRWKICQAP